MIKDEAFFGFARAGVVNGFSYPGILESGNPEGLVSAGREVRILGEPVAKQVMYPDFLDQKDSPRYFLTESFAVVPNGIELLQRPRRLVERILEVRREAGYSRLIYVQGVSDPYIIPVLAYLGVQLFDDAYTVAESMNGIRYTLLGKTKTGGDELNHNLAFMRDQMDTLRKSIINGTLREIVEKFGFSSKALEILRILDTYFNEDVEPAFPIRTPYIKANSIESLERPDLRRYRDRLLSVYQKPSPLKIALILPCSARKPYSTSKSHQAILGRIHEFRKYIHEVIVTSPVGVVPRELEEAYPPGFYDIPVIGMWYEDEKKMMLNLMKGYFSRNIYERVIALIPEDLEFLAPAFPEGTTILHGGPGVKENLDSLRSMLKLAVEETGKSKVQDRKLETYKTIASFQFGNWIRDRLENTKIVNSYNQDMLVRNGEILLVYNRELGKFTINKKSAEFFVDVGKYNVEIDNFKPTSNVYAVGVLDATSDIRQEDEVVLTHKGQVMGVGVAKMPWQCMKELRKGVAVKVRN